MPKKSGSDATKSRLFSWVEPTETQAAEIAGLLVGYSHYSDDDLPFRNSRNKWRERFVERVIGRDGKHAARWGRALRELAVQYRKETEDYGALDWQKIIAWLIKYGPTIIKILLAILL